MASSHMRESSQFHPGARFCLDVLRTGGNQREGLYRKKVEIHILISENWSSPSQACRVYSRIHKRLVWNLMENSPEYPLSSGRKKWCLPHVTAICLLILLPDVNFFSYPCNKYLSNTVQVPGIWYVAERNAKDMLGSLRP